MNVNIIEINEPYPAGIQYVYRFDSELDANLAIPYCLDRARQIIGGEAVKDGSLIRVNLPIEYKGFGERLLQEVKQLEF